MSPTPEQLEHIRMAEEAAVAPQDVKRVRDLDRKSSSAGKTPPLPKGNEPLPFRPQLEAAFGADLSKLSVATGQAAALAPLEAHAACADDRLVFARSSPSLDEVAHEVAHALQADGGGGKKAVSTPDQAGEREASRAAKSVVAGRPVGALCAPVPGEISRKPWYSHVYDVGAGVVQGGADVVTGVAGMAWGAAKLTVGWAVAPKEAKKTWDNLTNTVSTVASDPKVLWHAMTDPIVEDWQNGRPGKAIGRGIFEVASVLVGTKGLDKLAKTSKVGKVADVAADLSKVDDVAKVVGKTDDVAAVTNKLDDVSSISTKVDDPGKVDDLSKVDDAIPEHTSNRLGNAPNKKELTELKKKYKIDSDSEAAAIWHVEMQNSTRNIIAGEDAIKKSMGINPKEPGIKMVDLMKTDGAGLNVPIEVKNMKTIDLVDGANAALKKFEHIDQFGNTNNISHFEIIANLESKLPPNFKLDETGRLQRLISGTDTWAPVEYGGKGVKITRADLGPISN